VTISRCLPIQLTIRISDKVFHPLVTSSRKLLEIYKLSKASVLQKEDFFSVNFMERS
jgi:hypothetical protein